MRDSAPDADALNQKIAELTTTLETERKERAEKDERARLDGLVTDFFADKHFVNAITADAIIFSIFSMPLPRIFILSRSYKRFVPIFCTQKAPVFQGALCNVL